MTILLVIRLSLRVEFYSKNKTLDNINTSLKAHGYDKNVIVLPEKDMLKKKKQIYFSGVFDKASPLQTASNLDDICTNKMLNEFVRNIRSMAPDNLIRDEFGIADFKENEILKRVALMAKYPDLSTNNALMFDFPDKLKISLLDYYMEKDALYSDIKDDEHLLDRLKNSIDDQRAKESAQGKKTKKVLREAFQNELGYLLLEETIIDSIKESDLSVGEVCQQIWSKLNNETDRFSLHKYAESIKLDSFKHVRTEKENYYENESNDDPVNESPSADKFDYAITILKEYRERLIEAPDYLFDEDFTCELADEIEKCRDLIAEDSFHDLAGEYGAIMYSIENEVLDYQDVDLEDTKDNIVDILDKIIEELVYSQAASNLVSDSNTDDADSDKVLKDFNAKQDNHMTEQKMSAAGSEGKKLKIVDNILKKYSHTYADFVTLSEKSAVDFVAEKQEADSNHDTLLFAQIEYKKVRDEFFAFINDFTDEKCKPQTFGIVIDHDDICSGYNGHFDMVGRLGNLAEQIDSEKSELLIMVDEGELYLHPDAQKNFVLNFLKMSSYFFKDKDIQLILSTNSPFILSDLPRTNILCLEGLNEEGLTVRDSSILGKTFGTNITTLLINEFFMDKGVVGSFAKSKINEMLYRLNYDENYLDEEGIDKKIIDIVGDSLVSRKLEKMREEKLKNSTLSVLDREIKYTEERLRRLKEERAEHQKN